MMIPIAMAMPTILAMQTPLLSWASVYAYSTLYINASIYAHITGYIVWSIQACDTGFLESLLYAYNQCLR
jgi:hypothetical protein